MGCKNPPCTASSTTSSQQQGMGTQGGRSREQQQTPGMVEPDSPLTPQLERDQARMRNNDRQKQLVADTDKLLSLATELKADVDKSNKDMLSLDVLKKAEEIEKLAHAVKEKMKGS